MNKLSNHLADKRFTNRLRTVQLLKEAEYNSVDLAPTFQDNFKQDPVRAEKLAEAYAVVLSDSGEHRELFQHMALRPTEERKALIQGYRNAGEGRGVVHAISQLPRQQGRLYMHDFILDEDGKQDKTAVNDVLIWLRDAGHEVRKMGNGQNPINPDTDAAVVEFFEDAADALSDAITAVVDAVGDTIESIGNAIADVASWVAEEVADLVNALLVAGKTVLELIESALMTGYELVKAIIRGLEDVGKAMFEMLDAAFQLVGNALITVLRAIDQLGRQLSELISWLATKTYDVIKKGVEALLAIGKSIGNLLQQAWRVTYTFVKNTVKAMLAVGKAVVEILQAAVTRPGDLFNQIIQSFNELGNTLAELYDEVIDAGADLIQAISEAAAEIGTTLVEFASYIATTTIEVAVKIYEGLIKAGKLFVDVAAALASHGFAAIKKIVNAAFELGASLIEMLRDITSISFSLLKDIVKAAFELGKTIAEFTWSVVEFTYRTAARLIEAALEVGAAVAEILEAVAGASYYILRKIVNGVLQALGPVGDIFEWLIDRGEDLASELWRETVKAIRYVKRTVTDVMNWALEQGGKFFERMLEIYEDIGTAISEVIDWAAATGDAALEFLGNATIRLKNSVNYVLSYLQKDFVPGIAKFVKGVMDAGYEVTKLIAWMASRTVEATAQIMIGAIEAGVTMATLLTETIKHPNRALENLLQAGESIGQTLRELYQVVLVDTAEAFLEEVTLTLRNLKRPVKEILNAVAEVLGGALSTVISILMATLSSYRPLTANEIADAKEVFGDSIDYSDTYIAIESVTNDIIFGIQDYFTGNPNSRAFVTANIINFDVDDALITDSAGTKGIDRSTLIHELCHVWQNAEEGPFYMAQAIHAMNTTGYNYGYDRGVSFITLPVDYLGNTLSRDAGDYIGLGGDDDLVAAAGNLNQFNREQQAQIAMHYFGRKVLLGQPQQDYAAFEPYIDEFKAAA